MIDVSNYSCEISSLKTNDPNLEEAFMSSNYMSPTYQVYAIRKQNGI